VLLPDVRLDEDLLPAEDTDVELVEKGSELRTSQHPMPTRGSRHSRMSRMVVTKSRQSQAWINTGMTALLSMDMPRRKSL